MVVSEEYEQVRPQLPTAAALVWDASANCTGTTTPPLVNTNYNQSTDGEEVGEEQEDEFEVTTSGGMDDGSAGGTSNSSCSSSLMEGSNVHDGVGTTTTADVDTEQLLCRICCDGEYVEEELHQLNKKLVYPCLCTAPAHVECIQLWIKCRPQSRTVQELMLAWLSAAIAWCFCCCSVESARAVRRCCSRWMQREQRCEVCCAVYSISGCTLSADAAFISACSANQSPSNPAHLDAGDDDDDGRLARHQQHHRCIRVVVVMTALLLVVSNVAVITAILSTRRAADAFGSNNHAMTSSGGGSSSSRSSDTMRAWSRVTLDTKENHNNQHSRSRVYSTDEGGGGDGGGCGESANVETISGVRGRQEQKQQHGYHHQHHQKRASPSSSCSALLARLLARVSSTGSAGGTYPASLRTGTTDMMHAILVQQLVVDLFAAALSAVAAICSIVTRPAHANSSRTSRVFSSSASASSSSSSAPSSDSDLMYASINNSNHDHHHHRHDEEQQHDEEQHPHPPLRVQRAAAVAGGGLCSPQCDGARLSRPEVLSGRTSHVVVGAGGGAGGFAAIRGSSGSSNSMCALHVAISVSIVCIVQTLVLGLHLSRALRMLLD
eukprot:CAMPEP_0185846474 /NCGR_PEP_ID=MMETSP1354-20130828/2091_1 /TAXON_ID=708628 /ORGANISM="Erythrolobus madagascarensis, Strain CCMP3276" /LENGTH=606 /DNA_ID=CAMNT_0028546605 /DNA_START=195 /DNA_END=2012 /DNA_ORIENTATION=-